MKCNNILEAVGHTPLIRLNRINHGLKPQMYVKAEFTNPGGSVKDRIGITMIDDAEKKGLLKPGGTIIEGTSGNTGMGLALVAAVRGYKCVFTTTDKQSQEKVDLLKALGAEVIVCPTAVEPEDPRSYYSVAKKLAREIPNSYYPNQYDNPMNPEAHYQTTGPEVWEQTEGKITHFVATMGTTATGSVDPLPALLALRERYGFRLHADAAGVVRRHRGQGHGADRRRCAIARHRPPAHPQRRGPHSAGPVGVNRRRFLAGSIALGLTGTARANPKLTGVSGMSACLMP